MKCIHYLNPINRVERVSDDEAAAKVKSGVAQYISKTLYKKLLGREQT